MCNRAVPTRYDVETLFVRAVDQPGPIRTVPCFASMLLTASIRDMTSAIASGDSAAFERLFRERFQEMYFEARRLTGRDESFCLDVVQDAMIRVIKSIKPMDGEARLRNWIFVVVRTCAYDRLRKESREKRRETLAVTTGQARGALHARDTTDAERLAWIERELMALEEPQMRMLVMRYRLGWTLTRIGKSLGMKPGAVDGRLGRLVALLRRRAKETRDE